MMTAPTAALATRRLASPVGEGALAVLRPMLISTHASIGAIAIAQWFRLPVSRRFFT